MRLLYVTYTVDRRDNVAGHVHDWVASLARRFELVRVVCIRAGDRDLPANVEVRSLGKEAGAGRLFRARAFLREALDGARACDAVFCQFSSSFVIAVWPFAAFFRRPVLFWWTHKHRDWKLELALRLSDRVVTASEGSFPIPSPKTRVVGHGIDSARFAPGDCPSPPRAFTVLTVGRLSPVKRLEHLVDAAALLRVHRPEADFRLVLVGGPVRPGDEAYRDALVARARAAGIADRTDFLGSKPFAEVIGYYRRADCFVNTCDTGGVDKAVLEAMSCALPIVTSNASFREVLGPAAADRWVVAQDALLLADRLEALLDMGPAARTALGREMRAVVTASYDLETLVGRIHRECEALAHRVESPRGEHASAALTAAARGEG